MSALELWIGGYGPEKSSHGHGLDTFRELVETETEGDVTVRITWNIMDEGRPNTDLLSLVESGEMFLCYFSSSYLGDRVPALNVLEAPFLFDSLDHAHSSLDGPLGERLSAEVRMLTGFEVLGFWDNGFRHLTNRIRPVREPSDCAGMTVRIQPNEIHEELMRCWGATPIAVELSEAVRLISEEKVDAQENPLANTVAYGVDRVHQHVTMTGHLYGSRGLWASQVSYEALEGDLQAITRKAAKSAVAAQRRDARALEERLRGDLEARGTQFVDLGETERSMFREASRPAIEMAQSLVPGDVFELVGS